LFLKKLSNKTFPGIRGKGNRYTVTKGILLSLFFELKQQKMIKNEAKVFLLHLSFSRKGGERRWEEQQYQLSHQHEIAKKKPNRGPNKSPHSKILL